jgi:uncharacterized protein YndB with AHSA1/START domain
VTNSGIPPQGSWTLRDSIVLPVARGRVFEASRRGYIFCLTGADQVTFDFEIGGSFTLEFSGRGTISGRFLEIESSKRIAVSWNVTGFSRPDEFSRVLFTIAEQAADSTRLALEHSGIQSKESMEAKGRAWREILRQIDSKERPGE